jgi:hypothetical protein
LERVCGPEVYNATAQKGWEKIFSKMLKLIVPLSVKYELQELKKQRAISKMHFHGSSSVGDSRVSTSASISAKASSGKGLSEAALVLGTEKYKTNSPPFESPSGRFVVPSSSKRETASKCPF